MGRRPHDGVHGLPLLHPGPGATDQEAERPLPGGRRAEARDVDLDGGQGDPRSPEQAGVRPGGERRQTGLPGAVEARGITRSRRKPST